MSNEVTELLVDWSNGDEDALAKLLPLVYDELHALAESYMRRERADHTLQPTALIHEAYLKLVDQNRVQWRNRAHFFGVAAQLMRRITLLHVRRLRAAKRGGETVHLSFDESFVLPEQKAEDLVELDEALNALTALEPRLARVVELRYFGGMTTAETAEVLGISPTSVKREWRSARAWLLDRMGGQGASESVVAPEDSG